MSKDSRLSFRRLADATAPLDVQALAATPGQLNSHARAYEHAPRSCTLRDRNFLYHIGLLSFSTHDLNEFTKDFKAAAESIFSHCQERNRTGAWHRDAVDFSDVRPVSTSLYSQKDTTCVRYYRSINAFQQTKTGWKVVEDETTVSQYCCLPPGGGRYIVPAEQTRGVEAMFNPFFNPFSGTPLATVASRDEAVQAWRELGVPDKLAEAVPSRFYRWRKGSGLACVASISGNGGPFSILIVTVPDHHSHRIGRFSSIGSTTNRD